MSNDMQTYIALLRGINVGGHNKLPMKALVELLQGCDLALENIRTYLQTGNITFQATKNSKEAIAAKMMALTDEHFGFKPEIIILNKAEFEIAIRNNPYQDQQGNTCHFYFCQQTPQLDVVRLEKLLAITESYQLRERVFYLHAPEGIGKSKLAKSAETCLGVKVTARNLNTVNKIAIMFS